MSIISFLSLFFWRYTFHFLKSLCCVHEHRVTSSSSQKIRILMKKKKFLLKVVLKMKDTIQPKIFARKKKEDNALNIESHTRHSNSKLSSSLKIWLMFFAASRPSENWKEITHQSLSSAAK